MVVVNQNRTSDELARSQKPAIFFANGLGDGVLALPAIRALSIAFEGRAKLILQAGPHQFLFENLPAKKITFLKMWSVSRGRMFDAESAENTGDICDTFISLAEWKSSSLSKLRKDCHPEVSIGVLDDSDIQISTPSNFHQFDHMFCLPQYIFPDLTIDNFSYPINFSRNIRGAGDEILKGLAGNFLVGIHPESLELVKSCTIRFTEQLVKNLLQIRSDMAICLFALDKGYSALDAASDRLVLFNYLPFELACYLLSKMDLFIGVDSCFLHVADLCRVPGIGLFGPTNSNHWGFRFCNHAHVYSLGREQMKTRDIVDSAYALIHKLV